MTSGIKFNEALQKIIDHMKESGPQEADIEAIEQENAKLRQAKINLMAQLNNSCSTVNSSSAILKDMLTRLMSTNQTRAETQYCYATQTKEYMLEVSEQICSFKKKMMDFDPLTTTPHDEVQTKILEMEQEIDVGRAKIRELAQTYAELKHGYGEETENALSLQTLKSIQEEQRNLLEKLQ